MLYDEIKACNIILTTNIIALEANVPNVFCVKNKYKKEPGTGAFEISYKGIVIYSKKFTGLFP
jgi:predicted Rdx family selenoprotein